MTAWPRPALSPSGETVQHCVIGTVAADQAAMQALEAAGAFILGSTSAHFRARIGHDTVVVKPGTVVYIDAQGPHVRSAAWFFNNYRASRDEGGEALL